MKKNNKGRGSVRRGRIARSAEGPVDLYISGMFRAEEDGVPKEYASTQQMRAGQVGMVADMRGLNDAMRDMFEEGRDAARIVAEEVMELEADLIEQTPWHEDGPTDPPKHAAEVWDVDFYPNEKNSFTMTINNPKDYMPFLEAGWSPQAPAGWIAALWLDFKQRILERFGRNG